MVRKEVTDSECLMRSKTAIQFQMYVNAAEENNKITRHQDDEQSKATYSLFPITMIATLHKGHNAIHNKTWNKHRTPKWAQQQQSRRLSTDSNFSHSGEGGGGGLNAFYCYQIFALDSVGINQNILSLHGGFITIEMYHHIK